MRFLAGNLVENMYDLFGMHDDVGFEIKCEEMAMSSISTWLIFSLNGTLTTRRRSFVLMT